MVASAQHDQSSADTVPPHARETCSKRTHAPGETQVSQEKKKRDLCQISDFSFM